MRSRRAFASVLSFEACRRTSHSPHLVPVEPPAAAIIGRRVVVGIAPRREPEPTGRLLRLRWGGAASGRARRAGLAGSCGSRLARVVVGGFARLLISPFP